MRTYGQYCPIARGAEIFAERWTPLIIRNVQLCCETFGEILEGAPGLSRTLLTQRLKQLERLGVVESAPKAQGRGYRYQLTSSGHDLFRVCQTLGEWGARWLEIAPENLDPFVALWSMCTALRRDRLPDKRVVIRFDFTGFRPHERYWLLIEHRETEICKTYSGLDEDLYITADAEAFVKWHAGQLLGGSNPRLPDPARWPVMARTGLPDLERPQQVCPHQARRRRCHRELTQRHTEPPQMGAI
jgi:DNA-binding HxlR family transcriptional regulator